jgi:hypothetical protein
MTPLDAAQAIIELRARATQGAGMKTAISTDTFSIEFDKEDQQLPITIWSTDDMYDRIYLSIDEAAALHTHLGELIELAKKEATHDPA